jgi:hypothetical protein
MKNDELDPLRSARDTEAAIKLGATATRAAYGPGGKLHAPILRNGKRFWRESWIREYLDAIEQDSEAAEPEPGLVTDMRPHVTRAPARANPKMSVP